jgi:hypothetical protein
MVFAFVWLAREVQNGGFHQYFSNSAGDFWKDVLNGLGAIGDEDGKRQFEHVLSIFPGSSLSEDRETRNVQLDELEERDKPNTLERFEEVDSAYAIRPFPRWELILNYVKAHPDEFDLKKA